MLVHAQKHHNADKFHCNQCDHTTNSKYNLEQHQRGAHGKGWQALCGKTFSWSTRKVRHQKTCADCAKEQKKLNKKANKLKKNITK